MSVLCLVENGEKNEEADHFADLDGTGEDVVPGQLLLLRINDHDEAGVADYHAELRQLSDRQITFPRATDLQQTLREWIMGLFLTLIR